MRVRNHTVSRIDMTSGPAWYVKNADGVTVASVFIYCQTNCDGAFCRTTSGTWAVHAYGPSFHKYRAANIEEDSYISHPKAEKLAVEAGEEWSDVGHTRSKADGLSKARKVAREKAWPFVKKMLGVE